MDGSQCECRATGRSCFVNASKSFEQKPESESDSAGNDVDDQVSQKKKS